MGSYFTRTRAWVYIAFYDEYVGRHIHLCCLGSLAILVPSYLYGLKLNRIVENNFNHMLYHWQYADKRNRLTHNLIMEHFEMHKEHLERVTDELDKHGPMIFYNLERTATPPGKFTENDLALIDELSGYNNVLNNFMQEQNLPETTREKFRVYMREYKGDKPKEVALNEMAISMFGGQR